MSVPGWPERRFCRGCGCYLAPSGHLSDPQHHTPDAHSRLQYETFLLSTAPILRHGVQYLIGCDLGGYSYVTMSFGVGAMLWRIWTDVVQGRAIPSFASASRVEVFSSLGILSIS